MAESVECSLFIDDFTGERSVIVSKVAGKESAWISLVGSKGYPILQVSFVATPQNLYIRFFSISENYRMAKGDELILLLEDGASIKFRFDVEGKNGCNLGLIRPDTLQDLANINLTRIRATTRTNQEVFLFNDGNSSPIIRSAVEYQSENDGRELFKAMAAKFTRTIAIEFPALLNYNTYA